MTCSINPRVKHWGHKFLSLFIEQRQCINVFFKIIFFIFLQGHGWEQADSTTFTVTETSGMILFVICDLSKISCDLRLFNIASMFHFSKFILVPTESGYGLKDFIIRLLSINILLRNLTIFKVIIKFAYHSDGWQQIKVKSFEKPGIWVA